MPGSKNLFLATAIVIGFPVGVHAEGRMLEDFETAPEVRWEFLADTVMGGVSSGHVEFLTEETGSFARLTGTVSTENRGGFIQFRRKLDAPPPDETKGIRLVVRGNDQRYFVHVRTKGTLLPWQYYQSGFDTSGNWTEILLPLTAFKASGRLLRPEPAAKSLTSIGVVAYGRDHEAEIDVREIGFY